MFGKLKAGEKHEKKIIVYLYNSIEHIIYVIELDQLKGDVKSEEDMFACNK